MREMWEMWERGAGEKCPREEGYRWKLYPFHLYLKLFLLILLLSSCSSNPNPNPQPTPSPPVKKESGVRSTFFGIMIDQVDEVGRLLWKVQAKQAQYTAENKLGTVQNPFGELYQDGKVVYQVRADTAEVERDAQKLFLKGKIIAVDPTNGVELRGNELEWRPKEDLLIVRKQINGNHKQVEAVAREARVKTREQRVEFIGGVVANAKESQLQMRTEQLLWPVKEEKLIASKPLQIDRYKNKQITDRGRGDAAEVNLKTNVATVTKNAQIELADPPMQIVSGAANWNLKTDTVTTNGQVRVLHRAENVRVTANQGEFKIPQKVVFLKGNVTGVGQRSQSINSQSLTWFLDKELIEAQGNVIYKQVDPPLTFKGEKAFGNINTQNISVTGGSNGSRVVTEIIPQPRE